MKYPNGYKIDQDKESTINQEITLVNDSKMAWPKDTRLKLCDLQTDVVKFSEAILIGAVPTGAKVKISFNIITTHSKQIRHSFAYQLCTCEGNIGLKIKFNFTIMLSP